MTFPDVSIIFPRLPPGHASISAKFCRCSCHVSSRASHLNPNCIHTRKSEVRSLAKRTRRARYIMQGEEVRL